MNILLLEDDELTLNSLSYLLTQMGHTVYPANNGGTAVDVVLDNPIDLIICDLMVPILSGVSFLSSRGKFVSLDVQVIAMSSLKDGEAMLRSLFIDFGYFLQKPVDNEKLMELLSKCQPIPKMPPAKNQEIGLIQPFK